MSKLHDALRNVKAKGIKGAIDLYDCIAAIKEEAKSKWLVGLGKNGFEHSERLEEYLDALTKKPLRDGRFTPAEIFVLLCAVYLHDIGYRNYGRLEAAGHPKRSFDLIFNHPEEYLLGDFPAMRGSPPRAAEAVAWVCVGHSEERCLPLKEIPNDFADQALSRDVINLRKLSALLRMADEADDPYLRLVDDSSFHPIRATTPLVQIGEETIAWHWNNAGVRDPGPFANHLREKQSLLLSSIDYLSDLNLGNWYLVLHPQVEGSFPFMPEPPVDTFVGRQDDLRKLHEIIQEQREGAITGIVGTGGMGKTELAKRYAHLYRRCYPGGVFWASLKESSNWREEATKILRELRPSAEPTLFPDEEQAKEAMKKVLARKGALLIIDNVTEANQILKPGCFLLVTTREKDNFGIMPHRSIHRLGGLSIEEGLDLLESILGKDPRLRKDLQAAGRIVDILGGMPLAVEIAAKHLADAPTLPLTEYIALTKVEMLKIEGHPDKDVVASLNLSLMQLQSARDGSDLIALFEAASVCVPAGFRPGTLGAAAGLGERDNSTLEQLAGRLHNRSLFELSDKTQRYSLHPLLLQLSMSRLGADKDREKRFKQNHCLYFLDYARQATADKLIDEKEGLWQAMVQVNQLLKELMSQFLNQVSRPYKDLLNRKACEEAFRYLLATNLINIDELGESKFLTSLLEPLLEMQESLKETSVSWLLTNLGIAHAKLSNYPKAIELYQQALEIHRRIGNVQGEGNALTNLGIAHDSLGDFYKAIELYEQALGIFRHIGDVQGEGNALANLGVAYKNLGDYPKAIELYEQALGIFRHIGDVQGEGNALANLGNAYLQLSNYPKAIELYQQALEIDRRIGNVQGEGGDLTNLGNAYAKTGKKEKARECFEASKAIFKRLGLDHLSRQVD